MKFLGIVGIGVIIIFACFSKLDAAGDEAQGDYEIGLKLYHSKDYGEALSWFLKAAAK